MKSRHTKERTMKIAILILLTAWGSGVDCFLCPTNVLQASFIPEYFTSPGFPFGYPNNMECSWILQSPVGHQVEVVFIEVLTESCCDIIELRDGNSSHAGLLATYRGNVTESMYVSSFGSLYINFRSDDSHVYYGFLAEYRIATTNSECGGFQSATAENQSLVSPGWPVEYRNNLHCTWTIQAPEGKGIFIAFSFVDTESCCDFILVRFGEAMNSRIREIGGTISAELLPRFISTGRKIQIVFRSDSTLKRIGFLATFIAVDADKRHISSDDAMGEKCGEDMCVSLHKHQSFTTPKYPLKHDNDLDCTWILTAPSNAKIMLWFTSVQTEECCDFIKIRDGEFESSRKIGVLSGRHVMYASFLSTNNKLRVHFQSDMTNTYKGFRAVFAAIRAVRRETCGGTRFANTRIRKYIATPNWPLTPPPGKCVWNITGPAGTSIIFNVVGFKTETNGEELLFYDVRAALKPFATMNGKSMKSRFISSTNFMVVVFDADFSTTEGGFRGFYKATSNR